MEKLKIIEFFVRVEGDLVGVKFNKVLPDGAGIPPYYEFQMARHFQMNGDMDVKRCGQTFTGIDLHTLMLRLTGYLTELSLRGVAHSEPNEEY